jgi:hypothetical protein
MQAYAWDLQTNALVTQNFTVRHWRDTKQGGYALTDERDIYELTANQGSRRLRGCINSVLPSDLVKAAEAECKKTLAGDNDEPIKDRIRKLIAAFTKYGVTAAMIESRLGHALDASLPEEIADLRAIYTSIKTGVTAAGEWFGGAKPEREAATEILADAPAPKRKQAKEPATVEAVVTPEPVTVEVAPAAQDDADIFG